MCPSSFFAAVALLLCCLGAVLGLADKTYTITQALPNGAASTTSSGIDLETVSTSADLLADIEFSVFAPALTTTELGDTQTITYIVQTATDAAFTSPTDLIASLFVQTGAGGAGAATNTKRFRLPTNVQRYVRIKATKTGASNASTASLIFKLLQLA
jgi:hypothetical protein